MKKIFSIILTGFLMSGLFSCTDNEEVVTNKLELNKSKVECCDEDGEILPPPPPPEDD